MGREVRRVPLGFDWPLRSVWPGFRRPVELALPTCPVCELPPAGLRVYSDGLSPYAREVLRNFGDLRDQGEVDYLVEHHQLRVFGPFHDSHEVPDPVPDGARFVFTRNARPAPTVAQINTAADRAGQLPYDKSLVVRLRCERAGVDFHCRHCGGTGHVATAEQTAAFEAWTPTSPPDGDGWQLWETTSEGSPISPVFATDIALAGWMADPARGRDQVPVTVAASFIAIGTTAADMFAGPGGFVSGVEAVGLRGRPDGQEPF